MRSLLAITTYNQIHYTDLLLKRLKYHSDVDVLIVDDFSTDNYPALAKHYGVGIITKDKGYGPTHSWNLAYQKFKYGNYNFLFISNNDVIIPDGALGNMARTLQDNMVVVPFCNPQGISSLGEQQKISRYKELNLGDYDSRHAPDEMFTYETIQEIQDKINNREDDRKLGSFGGHFMGFNGEILDYEFEPDKLFDPSREFTGGDNEIFRRLRNQDIRATLCKSAYVFHFRYGSSDITTDRRILQVQRELDFSKTDSAVPFPNLI
tara:strand:+ start:35656 stop:36447 length:792 start_codon:yes stop_codon:yes gene_type:complete